MEHNTTRYGYIWTKITSKLFVFLWNNLVPKSSPQTKWENTHSIQCIDIFVDKSHFIKCSTIKLTDAFQRLQHRSEFSIFNNHICGGCLVQNCLHFGTVRWPFAHYSYTHEHFIALIPSIRYTNAKKSLYARTNESIFVPYASVRACMCPGPRNECVHSLVYARIFYL